MSKTLTIFCLLALIFPNLYAQNATVKGVAADASTGEPLIAATVIAGTTGTVTDFNGSYTLSLPPGQYTLTFHYVGYEALNRDVDLESGQSFELNVALKQEAAVLETATVTSGKHSKPLSEVTVSMEVLRPGLIQSTGKLTLDAAIEKLPGVTVIDGQANIRAGSGYSQGAGSRVLLLVDDMPILTADAGFPNWDDVPIENISQVEVVKGAASALFGSSALNGIINVRTAYPKSQPETEAAVYYTHFFDPADKRLKWWDRSPYTMGAQLAHRRKIGKLDLVLGSYYLKEESVNKDAFREFGRFNFSTRYRVTDRLTIGLNGNLNAGKTASFFYWVSDTMAYVGVPSTFSNRERFRYNIDPYLNYYDKGGNRHRLQGRFFNVDNNNDNNQGNSSDMYYAEYQFQRQMPDIGLVVSAGAVYQGTYIKAELYGDTTFKSRNYAAYLQLDKKFFDRLNVSAGFRYEDNLLKNPGFIYKIGNKDREVLPSNEQESKPVVRFGLNYRAAEATFLRASWGQGYRFPTVAEKFIVTNVGFFNVLPNPTLQSETGWSAEIGIKQGFQISSFKGYLDLAAFTFRYYNMMEFNLVTQRDPVDGTLSSDFRSINIGDTESVGFEVTAAGQGDLFGLPFTLLTGYTFVDPRFLEFDTTQVAAGETPTIAQINAQNSSSDDNILKYRSRHLFKFDLETKYKGAFLGVEVFHNSNIEAIDSPFLLIIGGLKRFREKHDQGYTLINLRTGYSFSEHMKVSLLLNNLANIEYSSRPGLLDPPRNLTARMDFKF
ncbi:MAG: TonB-dependent receptor [Lewinellaceae bacterium]|nr:TonB-dependent receptor [Lewinellaceae bacterium]